MPILGVFLSQESLFSYVPSPILPSFSWMYFSPFFSSLASSHFTLSWALASQSSDYFIHSFYLNHGNIFLVPFYCLISISFFHFPYSIFAARSRLPFENSHFKKIHILRKRLLCANIWFLSYPNSRILRPTPGPGKLLPHPACALCSHWHWFVPQMPPHAHTHFDSAHLADACSESQRWSLSPYLPTCTSAQCTVSVAHLCILWLRF